MKLANKHIVIFSLCLSLLSLSACQSLIVSRVGGISDHLATAILNQNDPQTVKDGMPSYLLLVDGLIEASPNNVKLLRSGAKLYSTYAFIFVSGDNERAKRLSWHSYEYAQRALCIDMKKICDRINRPYEEFVVTLDSVSKSDLPTFYTFAVSWAGLIQANRSDWNAVANLAKVKACMAKVVAKDDGYDNGGAHGYLALMSTILPSALGGKPEQGKIHFERAIAISQGNNLMIKVRYAEKYARLVFDRQLHDRLLNEVLQADTDVPGFTLTNTMAKQQALQLLLDADEYF